MTTAGRDTGLRDAAREIGEGVLGPNADDVDATGRFPTESVDAFRQVGFLRALISVEEGGLGATLDELSDVLIELGRWCASSAMILALHSIQVACLVRHGETEALAAFRRRVAAQNLLLASAAAEAEVRGDVRSSVCAVRADGESFTLHKLVPVISYGSYADAVFATARRTPDSAPSDQVLVICEKDEFALTQTSDWDALGFRGTCSPGFVLDARGPLNHVFPTPFGDLSSETMLPVTHILWASLWLGMAKEADARSRRFAQQAARRSPGSLPPSALRLSEMALGVQQLDDLLLGARARLATADADPDYGASIAYATSMNSLKVAASGLLQEIVQKAFLICGMAGYANHSPFSLGRILRDAVGAQLMINNDRINVNNAELLLVQRGR
ncbi:acyl-CoA/acyl-ACP dehydrogenase [Microbacterium horticulturae]|uniref:Acyl-CoA/acyl-ACP dehydrogenase n=1 Tax=Microbacterium horticulturae TaxID=3028316 RepID=A0ABY8BYB6_9MICO|nr:acyl-CoA dehydrogenase family protein [Microbacterium sp. KACC 23027]WEG09179.1 acyl-CoA/acyl-ACP dehydrogenase [Microbacterium sp. KACC 23027]